MPHRAKMAQPCPRKRVRRAPISRSASPKSQGNSKGQQKEPPEDRLSDEDKTSRIPARIEREERAHAVVVGPVEQDVRRGRDKAGEVQPSPADHARLEPAGRGAPGSRFIVGKFSQPPLLIPAMEQPDAAHDDRGHDRDGNERVGDAAMMLQAFHGPAQSPENVHIRGFGSQRRAQGGVGGLAIESRAPHAGAGEEMREWLHAFCSPY